MEKIYNKLVRNKIPEIILEDTGNIVKIKIIKDDLEYKRLLYSKLEEELEELLESNSIEEIVDVMEVLNSLAELKGVSDSELNSLRDNKKQRKGDFSKRIYLISEESN